MEKALELRLGKRHNIAQSDKDLKKETYDEQLYWLRDSTSSFNLSEVDSFFYGPFFSRFWMMRKETLLM